MIYHSDFVHKSAPLAFHTETVYTGLPGPGDGATTILISLGGFASASLSDLFPYFFRLDCNAFLLSIILTT